MTDTDLDQEKKYTMRTLIFTGIGAIAATVLILEMMGKIVHTENKDVRVLGEFSAIHVALDETFRMSPRPSELHAVCMAGYLGVASDTDPHMRALLIDYRNRGVKCAELSMPAMPAMPDMTQPTGPYRWQQPDQDEGSSSD